MTLDEARAHIGAGVVYHSGHGRPEDGEIVRVSDLYVFVLLPITYAAGGAS